MDKNQTFTINQKSSGKYFTLMIMLYVLITFVGQIILGAIKVEGVVYYAISSTFSLLSLVAVIIYALKDNKENSPALLSISKFSIKYIILAIMLFLGMFLGFGFVNSAFVNLLNYLGVSINGASVPLNNTFELILFIVLLAVLPAVIEELFFRGIILSLLKDLSIIPLAITIGLCFSLYHCSFTQLVYQFIYGFSLTLLALSAKSVIPSIITHLLNNLTVILLEYFNVYIDLFNPITILLGLVFLALFFVFIIKDIIKEQSDNNKKEKQGLKGFYLYASFGIIICAVLLISSLFGG